MAKIEILEARLAKLTSDKKKYIESIKPQNFKSEYITCRSCSSRIRKDLYKGLSCPACGNENLSETAKDRIDSFNERIKKAKSELTKEKAKRAPKLVDYDRPDGKLNGFYFTNVFDVGYDVFLDEAYVIPLIEGAKRADYLSKIGDGAEEYVDTQKPYILLEHQEEKYGNDTHGWCASYHYVDGNCYKNDYICSKEPKHRAMSEIRKFIARNEVQIKADLASA